jgi:hypothetical protein
VDEVRPGLLVVAEDAPAGSLSQSQPQRFPDYENRRAVGWEPQWNKRRRRTAGGGRNALVRGGLRHAAVVAEGVAVRALGLQGAARCVSIGERPLAAMNAR